MKETAFVAIRHNNEKNQDWIDLSRVSGDLETVKRASKEMDRGCPSWAIENKVVRYAQVEIKVLDES